MSVAITESPDRETQIQPVASSFLAIYGMEEAVWCRKLQSMFNTENRGTRR
jgi:hypothetical protein